MLKWEHVPLFLESGNALNPFFFTWIIQAVSLKEKEKLFSYNPIHSAFFPYLHIYIQIMTLKHIVRFNVRTYLEKKLYKLSNSMLFHKESRNYFSNVSTIKAPSPPPSLKAVGTLAIGKRSKKLFFLNGTAFTPLSLMALPLTIFFFSIYLG